jgi:DNA-binding MarR family transcriptional regulator
MHMNRERRAILRVLLRTDRHLNAREIANVLSITPDTVRRALARFEERQWVVTRDGSARRFFTINPEARTQIEVVLEGWPDGL